MNIKIKKRKIICVSILLLLLVSVTAGVKHHNEKVAKEDFDTMVKITSILNKKNELNTLYIKDNGEIVDEEIAKCDELIEELYNINKSGSVRTEYLKNILDNSVEAINNKKTALKCSKKLDLEGCSEYFKKEKDNEEKINLEIQRYKNDK